MRSTKKSPYSYIEPKQTRLQRQENRLHFKVPNNSAKSSDGNQFRITPQQNADYAEAVKTGNSVLAQQMVDEAAKANEYTSAAYHGTN